MCSRIEGRRVIVGILAVLTVACPMRAAAEEITIIEGDGVAEIHFGWKRPVRVEGEPSDRELLLRSDAPLADPAIEEIPRRLPNWIESVSYGYDSVLVRANRPVNWEVRPAMTGVVVRLETRQIAATPDIASDTVPADPETRRLVRLRARASLETGNVATAGAELDRLLAVAPHDTEALGLLAEVRRREGDPAGAIAAYERALSLRPDTPWMRRALDDIRFSDGPGATAGSEWRRLGNGESQWMATVSAWQPVTESLDAGIAVETRHLDRDEVQRPDGRIDDIRRTIARGEVWLRQRWSAEHRTRAGLLGGPHGAGVGLEHAIGPKTAETTANIAIAEPEFSYVEGIVGNGRRHRARIGHDRRIVPDVTLGGGISVNRYAVAGVDRAADTVGVDLSARWAIPDTGSQVSIGYSLDGEYVIDRTMRTNVRGEVFRPLPVETREVHVGDVSIAGRFDDSLRYGVTAGFAFDRYGDSGAIASTRVGWRALDNLELGLEAGYSQSTARSDGSSSINVGAYLRRPFDLGYGGRR